MGEVSRQPVPPVPPNSSAPSTDVPASGRSRAILLGLLLVAAGLIGWRWYADHYGMRPTELRQGVTYQLDLNRATEAELMQIPGVGPQLAQRIVAHREGGGRFARVEDLDAIPGIGDATLSKIRPWVTVLAVQSDAGIEPDLLTRKPTSHGSKGARPISGLVNVNTATLEELDALPNIGPVYAQRIIDERKKAPFTSIEDLRRVSGIGPKRREALRGLVVFADQDP